MNIVTIKEVKGVVTCADDGTAEHVFNVKNATQSSLKVGMHISASEPTQSEWLTIDETAEHELDVETMTQVTVKIQVPADCAPGKYGYRLRVFDPAKPGERFTDGETVYFEVPAKQAVKVAENGKKPFKWWIPAAIAAGVIIVGIVVWLLWPKGITLPDFTKDSLANAEQFLKANNIAYTTEIQLDPNPQSTAEILAQTPGPDTKLKAEEKVILKIAGVKVPPLINLTLFDALQKISTSGLDFNAENNLHSARVTNKNLEGTVRQQKPARDSVVSKNTTMELWIGVIGRKNFGVFITPQQEILLKKQKSIKLPQNFLNRSVEPESE